MPGPVGGDTDRRRILATAKWDKLVASWTPKAHSEARDATGYEFVPLRFASRHRNSITSGFWPLPIRRVRQVYPLDVSHFVLPHVTEVPPTRSGVSPGRCGTNSKPQGARRQICALWITWLRVCPVSTGQQMLGTFAHGLPILQA